MKHGNGQSRVNVTWQEKVVRANAGVLDQITRLLKVGSRIPPIEENKMTRMTVPLILQWDAGNHITPVDKAPVGQVCLRAERRLEGSVANSGSSNRLDENVGVWKDVLGEVGSVQDCQCPAQRMAHDRELVVGVLRYSSANLLIQSQVELVGSSKEVSVETLVDIPSGKGRSLVGRVSERYQVKVQVSFKVKLLAICAPERKVNALRPGSE